VACAWVTLTSRWVTLRACWVDWVQYSFYVSMLEVYNDQLRDLIHEPAPPARRGDPVVRPKVGRFVAAYSD
jgi:hypothetical protein